MNAATLPIAAAIALAALAGPARAEGDADRFAHLTHAVVEKAKPDRTARLPRNARCQAIMANSRMDGRILTQPRIGGSLGVGLTGGSLGIVPALGLIFTPTNHALATAVESRAIALCQAETHRDQVARWIASANASARMRSEAAKAASLERATGDLAAVRDRFQKALSAGDVTLNDFMEVDRTLSEMRLAIATSKIEMARHRAVVAVAGRSGKGPSVGGYLAAARAGQAAENELRRAGARNLTITAGLGLSISGSYAMGDAHNREDERKSEDAAHRAALSQWADIPNSVSLLRTQAAREAQALHAASAMLREQRSEVASMLAPLADLDGIRAESAKATINARLAILDAERARMDALASGLSQIAGSLGAGAKAKPRRARRA